VLSALISSFRVQPKALFKLCTVEVWERFGFVTTVALTALFFASPVTEGGLGWNNADTLLWLGYYAALLFMLPVIGGTVSDRLTGHHNAIQIGGMMMAAGYFGLGCTPYVINLSGLDSSVLKQIFEGSGLAVAHPTPDPAAWDQAMDAVRTEFETNADGQIQRVKLIYFVQTALLGLSFLLVALGNALFKPSVSASVGALYEPGDSRRDGGFTLFWTFINLGSFLAYIVGGGIAERYGWNLGYFVACAGMTAALVYFWIIKSALPISRSGRHNKNAFDAPSKLTRREQLRLVSALILTAFAVVFMATHAQLLGLISLFVQQDVDKTIGGFDVPTLWVTSVNPVVILLFAPIAAIWWDRLGQTGRNPSFVSKFVLALVILAAGEFVLVLAAQQAGAGLTAFFLVVIAIVALSLAEIPLQPIGLSMMSVLSPPRFVAMMIGIWLLSMAIANIIAGNVGALASVYGLQPVFFWSGVACAVTAVVLFSLRGRLLGWMALEEQSETADPLLASNVREPS